MIKAIYGTKDSLNEDVYKWKTLENIVRNKFDSFNYKEIRTPIFEETALFLRGIGEGTDIVGKEMYTFTDKGGTSITLKPEMTACVARAFIEHSLGKKQALNKLYYISPMFRQERPQAGRLRQFHQFGAEALGPLSPELDAEMIIMAYDLLKSFNIKSLELKINSLGKPESREIFKEELKGYLLKFLPEMSADSQKRYETNVLRIFDSKDKKDIEIMQNAPKLLNYLDEESLKHFETVQIYLNGMDICYEIDPKLVRGLDYYTDTTFEIVSNSVGSQSALCGGGRYDNLISEIGGDKTPGVGFAAGIERIMLAIENENSFAFDIPTLDFYIVRLDNSLLEKVFITSNNLRKKNYTVDFDYQLRSVKAQMREANRLEAKYTIFLGGEEYQNNTFVLKNMKNGEQMTLSLNEISDLTI